MEAVSYGAWPSPIGAGAVAGSVVRISDLQSDGDDAYWVEARPAERGRCVVVRLHDGRVEDVLPEPWSARTWVHEYGGGAFGVRDGVVCFSNAADHRLHVLRDGAVQPLTTPFPGVRFADIEFDVSRERIVCIVEEHGTDGVTNDIRAVSLTSGEITPLVHGHDFYSSPRISPDGSRLAWLSWDNPNMPWDGTELWESPLDSEGKPSQPRRVAGGAEESIFQPAWSPDSVLHFSSDRSGWWNVYRDTPQGQRNLLPLELDCGVPGWVFRLATYGFLSGGRLAVAGARNGIWELWIVDADGTARQLPLPYNDIDGALAIAGRSVVLVAGSPSLPFSVVQVDPDSADHNVVRSSASMRVDESMLSSATPITFEGVGGEAAHAYYYAPRNDSVRAPDGELPPLMLRAHGGPTSATSPALDISVQYWTSRGFAFVDVDYGGSTGYGRPYRLRLDRGQGVVDVGDCVAAAQHVAAQGLVDGARMVVQGGSAGGYIVLCAMTFHDTFAAGLSLFGISDLELLLVDTHKFEARYFDRLVGPYPEAKQVYHGRSPIHFIDRVRRPLLLLQGLDDPIVPPNQAQVMFDALRDRGGVVAYIGFPGEQHGFRQAVNIRRSLEAQLEFVRRVLGIDAAEELPPLEIANLT